MTSRDFCYWLQGYFEIRKEDKTSSSALTAAQVQMIERHLALVFKHEIDPSFGDEAKQQVLNEIHEDKSKKPPKDLQKVLQHPQFRPHRDPLIRC